MKNRQYSVYSSDMNDFPLPYIVSATDIRYKFKAIAEKIVRTGKPAVIVDNSKPLVVHLPSY